MPVKQFYIYKIKIIKKKKQILDIAAVRVYYRDFIIRMRNRIKEPLEEGTFLQLENNIVCPRRQRNLT